MHVRVIAYLVQYVQYNFKNILIYIYIYINRFISVRLSAELMYSVIYIYISVDRNDTCTSQEKNDHPQIRLTVLHIPPRATFCYFSAD